MGVLDGVWHVLNFWGPAVGVGLLSALLAKLLWRRELSSVRWARLAAWAVSGATLALLAGLWWTGRDGKMFTYGAMVLSCAVAMWWAGWVRR